MRRLTLFVFMIHVAINGMAQVTMKERTFNLTLRLITLLQEKKYDSIIAYFDPTMKRMMNENAMMSSWESLPDQFGELQLFSKTNVDTLPGFYVSETAVKFTKGTLLFRLSFDKELHIAGLYFMPKFEYLPSSTVNTLAFVEYKVNFGKQPYVLEAVFTVPVKVKNPPCVILISGSGPNDKDESVGPNKPFKDLAWGLASRGIAVFRFDKRTYVYGSQLLNDKFHGKPITIKEEYLDDVHDAFEYVRKSSKSDKKNIFLAGHSQGGMLMPLFCKDNKHVAGAIFLAANSQSIQDALTDQIRYMMLDSNLSVDTKQKYEILIHKAEYAKRKDLNIHTPDDSLPGSEAAYWLSLNNSKYLETVLEIKQPLLFIQGERDYQVPIKNIDGWKKAVGSKSNVTYKIYPKLNHLLLEGEGKPNSHEYSNRGNIPDYVLEEIEGWIKVNLKK